MKRFSFFAALLALCLTCSPAFSQPIVYPTLDTPTSVKKTGKNDVAIIVAVENYAFLPTVKGAVNNANDWETFFKSSLGVGKVHMLVDRQATREQVERFARTAAQESKSGGTVWFVFIGHGSPAKSGKDGLLVGVDAQQDPDSLFARGFAQQDLLNLLNAGKQEQTVVIVDACFSGRASDGQALAPAQPVIPTTLNLNLAKKTVVFSAAESSEFAGALPGSDRPAFSYLMLGALRGWSKDKGGDVTAQDALSFTQKSLRGIPGRFQQTPGVYGDDKLVLVRSTKEKDPGVYDLMRRSGKKDVSARPTSKPTAADQVASRLVIGKSQTRGPKDAPITIFAFADFQCQYSRRSMNTIQAVMKEYDGKVQLVFKASLAYHKEATAAHYAALAAGKQGKFWQMHNLLFATIKDFKNEGHFQKMAQDLGLDMQKFNDDFNSFEVSKQVALELAEGTIVDVKGTPAFFINGISVPGMQPLEKFKEVIDAELKKQN